mmetsp:Transcript_46277/g.142742  ORF Transcript_46277/g.142742 Transcript_46277/m.142742 type:complete len:309 (-) Transcript_46277:179-1105(-)
MCFSPLGVRSFATAEAYVLDLEAMSAPGRANGGTLRSTTGRDRSLTALGRGEGPRATLSVAQRLLPHLLELLLGNEGRDAPLRAVPVGCCGRHCRVCVGVVGSGGGVSAAVLLDAVALLLEGLVDGFVVGRVGVEKRDDGDDEAEQEGHELEDEPGVDRHAAAEAPEAEEPRARDGHRQHERGARGAERGVDAAAALHGPRDEAVLVARRRVAGDAAEQAHAVDHGEGPNGDVQQARNDRAGARDVGGGPGFVRAAAPLDRVAPFRLAAGRLPPDDGAFEVVALGGQVAIGHAKLPNARLRGEASSVT